MTESAPLDVPSLVAAHMGLFTWLATAADANPDRLVARGREGDEVVDLTLAELEEKSRRFANGLQSIGVRTGDVIGSWLPNRIEWLITEFACAALGVGVLGLNTRYRSHEMSHLLRTVDLSAIILPSAFLDIDFVGTLESALEPGNSNELASPSPRLIFLGDIPERARNVSTENHSFARLLKDGLRTEVTDQGSAISNFFTTSGSTSAPKVAGHDQTSILRHGYAGSLALDVAPDDRILAVLPLCGVFGFSAVMALLIGGGSALLVETFDASLAASFLEQYGVTHVVGGDEMLGAIFEQVPGNATLSRLRRGGIANFAGHAKEIVSEVDERWGTKLSGVYGSSELFALSALWPAGTDRAVRELGGGVVVDTDIQVRVRDLDTNLAVADGISGELQFRGYNVTPGYTNNAHANATSFTNDGWFKTGDLGYIAHGGFVYQCRSREALRLHGFLVEPGEIEDFLTTEPAIDEVHVVGVDFEAGTKAFAFARARDGMTLDETAILSRARRQIASYKVPERLFQVEEFPTTTGTNGTKIRFDKLRELAMERYISTSEKRS